MGLDIKDFSFPQDWERYRLAVKRFVETDLEAMSAEVEESNALPPALMPMLKKSGLLRVRQPREWGGMGFTLSEFWPIEAEVAKSHGTIRLVVHGHSHKWMPIYYHGTEAQKKKYLPILAEGERASFALTEPGTGTGVDIRTTAVKSGDAYVINGTKHLITLPNIALFTLVVAYTGDRSLGAKGISFIIVERDTPGFAVLPHKDTMGLRGCYHGILHFRDCRVPAENLLGKEGEGLDIALKTFLDPNRVGIAADCLGACEKMLELAVSQAHTRVTFGKAIGERQATQQMLAEMATDVYALKCMIGECARKYDSGEPAAVDAAMCKLFGIEATRRVSDQALFIHG
ncbi:MAG: acyl-CoA dehydrogenase family protein, partial [Chloroflexota bacterium]